MAITELEGKIETLLEIENFIEELEREAETIRDSVKEELNNRGVQELEVGSHIVRWIPVVTSRFSAKLCKERLGEEIYKSFLRESYSRRFSIA